MSLASATEVRVRRASTQVPLTYPTAETVTATLPGADLGSRHARFERAGIVAEGLPEGQA
jgi:hypothetical protein